MRMEIKQIIKTDKLILWYSKGKGFQKFLSFWDVQKMGTGSNFAKNTSLGNTNIVLYIIFE